MRILLIEDNPGDIRLLQEYLKEGSAAGGFQITQAGRLSTGLARLTEARFDAVLLDSRSPIAKGWTRWSDCMGPRRTCRSSS